MYNIIILNTLSHFVFDQVSYYEGLIHQHSLQCKAFSEKCRAIGPHQCAKTTFRRQRNGQWFQKTLQSAGHDL